MLILRLVLIVALPLLMLWCVEAVFKVRVDYSFKEWFATLCMMAWFSLGRGKTSKKESDHEL